VTVSRTVRVGELAPIVSDGDSGRALRTAPEAAASVTEVIVLPSMSRMGADRDTVRVGAPGGLRSTIPPLKSRRSRPFQV
jgi:hypothetical protein